MGIMLGEKSDLVSLINEYGVLPYLGQVGKGYAIQQRPEELEVFIQYCLDHDVKTFLEIGAGDGGLSYLLADAFGFKVTSIDIARPKFLHEDVEFICLPSDDAYRYVQHRLFDVVFIDGDHSYRQVKTDHENYAHLGRIVAFHDIAPGRQCCEGVNQYWHETFTKGLPHDSEAKGGAMWHYWDSDVSAQSIIAIGGQDAPGIGWYLNDNQFTRQPILEVYAQPLPDAIPDINIVSGTYNRFASLQRMINSARASVPYGITLRFTIVDGGSNDGSLEYLRAQPDVTLIEHGELRGIRAAYRDGFDAAQGKYIVTGNDDVEYIGDCLYQSLCYLETHPQAGGTAFYFDNPDKPGYFHVNYQGVERDGKKEHAPYAQIGMFRKWIGDAAGWWGGHDETYTAKNYGVDNYLTSRVLEMGYTVDGLERCKFHDHLVQDELRKGNAGDILKTGKHPDSIAWLDRFNDGYPVWDNTPVAPQETEHLRILYMPILAGETQREREQLCGLLNSLQKVALVQVYDYTTAAKEGRNVERDLLSLVAAFKPHIWHCQIQNASIITPHIFKTVRAAAPNMIVTNWNGDENRYIWNDSATLDIMQCCDLHLTVNPAQLGNALQHGVNAAFWPDSYQPVEPVPMPAFDVVFCGTNYAPRHSPKRYPRAEMIAELRARFPQLKIGVYGSNWDYADGEHTYDFAANHGTYAAAKLVIVDNMYTDQWGYMSDRLWNALRYGQCCLVQETEGLRELYGLREGVQFIQWSDADTLVSVIKGAVIADSIRVDIGEYTREYIQKYHSFDARVQQYLDLLPSISKKKC